MFRPPLHTDRQFLTYFSVRRRVPVLPVMSSYIYIRLPAHDTKTGTRKVGDHHIRFSDGSLIQNRCIHLYCPHIRKLMSCDILSYKISLILCEISRLHHTGSPEFFCQMDALSSWCCTHINDIAVLLWSNRFRHHHGAHILHIKKPLTETCQCIQMVKPGDHKCIV